MNSVLTHWNTLDPEEAARRILPCCGSQIWATRLAAQRPFASLEAVTQSSGRIWLSLPEAAWLEAFASHPRIGERHAAASPQSLAWSFGEQSTASADEAAKTALAEANRLYEERFHRTFIVCATGKSAAEILNILSRRLHNTPEVELAEAAEQQRQITNLRLAKWLEG